MKLSIVRMVFFAVFAGIWGMVCTEGAWGQVMGNTTTAGLSHFQGGAPMGSSTLGSFRAYSSSIESSRYDLSRSEYFQSFSNSGNLSNTGLLRTGRVKNPMQLVPEPLAMPMGLSGGINPMAGGGMGGMSNTSFNPSGGTGSSNFYRGSTSSTPIPSLFPVKGAYDEFGVSAEDLMGSKEKNGYFSREGYLASQNQFSRNGLRQNASRIGDSKRLSGREMLGQSSRNAEGGTLFQAGSTFGNSWPTGRKGMAGQGMRGRLYSGQSRSFLSGAK